MYELKQTGKVYTSTFVGTGSPSYEKRIYRTAVSQRLRNTALSSLSLLPKTITIQKATAINAKN